jgi:hypothetical protein
VTVKLGLSTQIEHPQWSNRFRLAQAVKISCARLDAEEAFSRNAKKDMG